MSLMMDRWPGHSDVTKIVEMALNPNESNHNQQEGQDGP